MASTAQKLDPELWEEAKADAREKFGGHSARAMQYAVKLYKQRGGRYKGPKKKDNRLKQWSDQDWTTKSGRPSRETGERYLPRAAIESLTSAEYGATTRAKRRGGGVGAVVAQPTSIREKTRKFRKVNPAMPTPAQIAARKKFAERARSGELAKMRKKSTRATSRKANPDENDLSTFLVEMSDRKQIKTIKAIDFYDALVMAVGQRFFSASSDSYSRREDVKTDEFFTVMVKDPIGTTTYQSGKRLIRIKQIKVHVALFADLKYKPRRSNPTATRSPERKRTKLIENGERKKNPMAPAVKVSSDSNFKYAVEAKRMLGSAGSVFETIAAFHTKAQAEDYAKAILATHPTVTLRVKTYGGRSK